MRRQRTLILGTILLGLLFTPGLAAADVSGQIVNQVWEAADSPVLVTGDLTIASLTITPGVVVEFAGNTRVTVAGALRVQGSKQDPVVLRPATDNTTGWQGIYFEATKTGSVFEWCRIEGAVQSAVHLVNANPSFHHCTFVGNRGDYGGAIRAVLSDEDLTVSDCRFEGNSASISGGAISATLASGTLRVSDSSFTGNRANPDFAKRNAAGGAVWVLGNSRFLRATFDDNQANAYTIYARYGVATNGGALWSGAGQCEITASAFQNNACRMTAHRYTPDTSYAHGGALYLESGSMLLQNSVVSKSGLSAQRRQVLQGSALYVGGGAASIVNSTLVDNANHAAIHNDNGSVELLNSILFFNNDSGAQLSGPTTVSYSDIQGAATSGVNGEGVIDLNPVLDEQHRLLAGSPAIDAGNPEAKYRDTFPPGLRTDRNDMGFLGGPQAHHWIDEPLPTTPRCAGREATIVGTDHADVIEGTPGDDVIVALRGDDVVYGRGGNDVICGGPGHDLVDGGPGNDRLYGQGGVDVLRGGPDQDRLHGGLGRDFLFGDDGADELHGAGGMDYLSGGEGDDALDGGTGDGDVCDRGAVPSADTTSAACESTPG